MKAVKHISDALPSKPTTLVGIGRGGFPVLTAMASYMDINRIGVVIVAVRSSAEPFARRVTPSLPMVLLPPPMAHESVLIVDDIIRTGMSMRLAKEALFGRDTASIQTATIFGHDDSPVDYFFAHAGPRTWVEFPWDRWAEV